MGAEHLVEIELRTSDPAAARNIHRLPAARDLLVAIPEIDSVEIDPRSDVVFGVKTTHAQADAVVRQIMESGSPFVPSSRFPQRTSFSHTDGVPQSAIRTDGGLTEHPYSYLDVSPQS